MQKKMVGILAGVAAAHAVLLTGLMASGGCTHPEILAPHTYTNGPEISGQVPGALEQPGETVVKPGDAPKVEGAEQKVEPVEPVEPVVVDQTPVKEPVAAGTTYTVQKGDTFNGIAYRHGVRPRDLAACNDLTKEQQNKLKIGQKLTIPAGGKYVAPKSNKKVAKATKPVAKKPAATASTPKATAERPADGVYVVKSGDTLDKIAKRYGTTLKALAQANNKSVADAKAWSKKLKIGEKIKLPANAGTAPAAVAEAKPAAATPAATPEPAKLDATIGDDLTPATTGGAPTTPVTAPVTTETPGATPAAAPTVAAPTVNTEAMEVSRDMTIDEFCKIAGTTAEELRRLNPGLPADGKLKGGSFLMVPQL